MTLQNHINEILNLYNYYNLAMIIDEKGTIEYFFNNRPDLNSLTEKDVLGCNIMDSYINLKEGNEMVSHVLKTGEQVINMYSEIITKENESIFSSCSIIPIKERKRIIGAVIIAKYIDSTNRSFFTNESILISSYEITKNKLYGIKDIKGTSKSIMRIKEKIEAVSKTDSTVLIYGETGTGKELVAESIHTEGHRKHNKFVSQNCAAIPPGLLESILFGTEEGSFTGARERKGLIETASGGTLFLDEINSMSIDTQAKILKAVDEKKIMRVGGSKPIPVDIRVIAAVNIKPSECVANNTLKEDLYYRLRVVEINIPPLRDRKQDIPILVESFIEHYNAKFGKYVVDISEELQKHFMSYNWPGNIRELKNCIERGFNMAVTPIIEESDVNLNWYNSINKSYEEDKKSLDTKLKERERQIIEQQWQKYGNLSKTSEHLGISRQALKNKLTEYNII